MILIHLFLNGKAALLDETNISLVEECEGEDDKKVPVSFTRIYLKNAIETNDDEIKQIDVQESADKICRMIK
jgi:hypothetical protein